MQTKSSPSNKGGPRPGRKPGYKSPATIKKLAFQVLGDILQDESAPPEARAMAACKLIDEVKS